MTLESSLWSTTKANLSPFGKLVRFENAIGTGEGDVVYCLRSLKPGSIAATGFLELKVAELPVRPMTPIRPHHLTIDQVKFAEDWSAAGGRAFLLLRMAPFYLLFSPPGIRALYQGGVYAGTADAIVAGRHADDSRPHHPLVVGRGKFPLGPILRRLVE